MKALVYEKAHKLADFAIALRDVAEPTVRDQDVLVEVSAIGVNPGEAFIRSTRSADPGGRVLLGFEFSGTVIGLGSKVGGFKIGDRVSAALRPFGHFAVVDIGASLNIGTLAMKSVSLCCHPSLTARPTRTRASRLPRRRERMERAAQANRKG